MKTRTLIPALLALTGCASSVLIEAEHISHPTVGRPFEKQGAQEDSLTQANLLLRWRQDGWYADIGAGLNLQRDKGFYGPRITGTARVGHEFQLRGAK